LGAARSSTGCLNPRNIPSAGGPHKFSLKKPAGKEKARRKLKLENLIDQNQRQ
jgi:hypothetical protein